MGGCCGAMKTGQKSLPENKQQKIDAENKQSQKTEALTCANNTTADALPNKGEIGNQNDTGGEAKQQEAAKVANGLNELSTGVVPVSAAAPSAENGLETVEEEVATKIVTQAMEAAIAETNGAGLEQQTSVTGSVGGVSDEEALNEWMKSDTRNALVIDEPTLETAAQGDVAAAPVAIIAEAAAEPAVQPKDVEVKLQEEILAVSHAEPNFAEETKNDEVQAAAAILDESVHSTEGKVQPAWIPSEEADDPVAKVDTWTTSEQHAVSEPENTSETVYDISNESQASDLVEQIVKSQNVDELPPQEVSVESSEPVNNEPESVPAIPSETTEPFKISAPVASNLASESTYDDNTDFNQDSAPIEPPTDIPSEKANVEEAQPLEPEPNLPAPDSVVLDNNQVDEFDSETLPPPPPAELSDEQVGSSPDFPELPVLEPAVVSEETSEEQLLHHSEPNDAVTSGESVAEQSGILDSQQMSPEVPDDVPVLESVVEQASEQRNEWWNGSGQEVEEVPKPVNGTSHAEDEITNSIQHEEGSILNSHDNGLIEDVPAALPSKVVVQEEESVPSEINHETNNAEASLTAQA